MAEVLRRQARAADRTGRGRPARAAISSRGDLRHRCARFRLRLHAFLDFLQIASLDLGFGGDGGGGVYHSIYDSYYWYTHFSDGDFTHSAALSRVTGTVLLRFADADVLPFEFKGTTAALGGYVEDIAKIPSVSGKLDLAPLRAAIGKLNSAAESYEKALAHLDRLSKDNRTRPQLIALNETLYRSERAFRYEPGLPKREWFKHLVYAPGLYTGYGVKTLPGIREGVEQNQWDEARTFVPIVVTAREYADGECRSRNRDAQEDHALSVGPESAARAMPAATTTFSESTSAAIGIRTVASPRQAPQRQVQALPLQASGSIADRRTILHVVERLVADRSGVSATRSVPTRTRAWRALRAISRLCANGTAKSNPSKSGSPFDKTDRRLRRSSRMPPTPNAAATRNTPPTLSGFPTHSSATSGLARETDRSPPIVEGRSPMARHPRWKLNPVSRSTVCCWQT